MGEGTETTFVVKSGLMPEFEPVNSKLGAALAAMVQDVEKTPGTPQRVQLKHGLRIEAIRDLDGSFRLQIGREDGVPSEQEWKTVLAHMPYRELAPIEPETFSYKSWNYLRGNWKGNGK